MTQHANETFPRLVRLIALLTVLICFAAGCGSNATPGGAGESKPAPGAQTATPATGQNTVVTVLLSSTANDELADFQMSLGSLTLTAQDGKSVTVFDSNNGRQFSEFMHENSVLEPLISVSVPQGVYTAATLTFSTPQFTFVTYNGGYIYFNTDLNEGQSGFEPAQVSLPTAITVSGQSLALIINSNVSESVAMSGSPQLNNFLSSVTPSFTITGSTSGTQDNASSAQITAFGEIGSLQTSGSGAESIVLTSTSGTSLTVMSDSNTSYEGIPGYSSLSPGMFADLDVGVQPDGTLRATRIEVPDTAARDLVTGPLFNIDSSSGVFNVVGERELGQDFASGFRSGGLGLQFTEATAFRIYGGFQAPSGLPFSPGFDDASLVPGQNVAISSQSIPLSGPYPVVTTMTLLPQTVNGTIDSVTSSGGLQVYTLTLASYDPLSTTNATVNVYVSSTTRLLTSTPLNPGEVLRFHGMVFSNHGSLAMVADQINDGVAEQ